MKKLILSFQFFIMLFALSFSTHLSIEAFLSTSSITSVESDPSKNPSINTDGICWLNTLPPEIHNKIAQYLTQYLTFNDRESDIEFTERVQKLLNNKKLKKFVSQGGYAELKCVKTLFGFGFSKDNILEVYSDRTKKRTELHKQRIGDSQYYESLLEFVPNYSKAILAEDFYSCAHARVFDLVSQKEIGKKSLKTYIFFPVALAISSDGTKLATIDIEEDLSLVIEDILNNTTKKIKISQIGTRLCFNKQGTKILVYRKNTYGKNEYYTYPVVSPEEHNLKSEKNLAAYFKQKGVCKQFPHIDVPKSINDLD